MADDQAPLSPMQLPPGSFQGMGGMLPPSSPIQAPQPGTQQDPLQQSLLQASQMGQQAYGEQLERVRNLAGTVAQLQQQQSQLQVPKMGYQPQFQPMTGQGAGRDVGNVLGNIGKVLLLGLASTGPGRSVQEGIYGPGERRYAAQTGALAERIKELQGQEQIEEQPMSAAASLQYRPFGMGAQVMKGEAAQTTAQAAVMNAQTKALAEQHKNVLQTEANRIREELGKGKLTQEAARTQLMGIIAREHNAMMTDIANRVTNRDEAVEQQRLSGEVFKTESDHILQDMLGIGPPAPAQPTNPTKPKTTASAAPSKPQGATHIGISSKDGKPYYLDAQGNKLGPAPSRQ